MDALKGKIIGTLRLDVTGHPVFFAEDALRRIAKTTLGNIDDFEQGQSCLHEITEPLVSA